MSTTIDHKIAKAVALCCLLVLMFLNGVGVMWLVFGLWPKSWAVYIGLNVTNLILLMLVKLVE